MTKATTPPAPSLQGKTPDAPPKPDATTRAAFVIAEWITRDMAGTPQQTLGELVAAAIRDAEAAARLAAIEEAARRQTALLVSAKHLLDFAERQMAGFPLGAEEWFAIRDAARREITLTTLAPAAPAPAKRAETEPAP